jgi:hypothetical protein
MKKILFLFLLTILLSSHSNSQGLTCENRDNNQILSISKTTNLKLSQPLYGQVGVQQGNDSIVQIKYRYYYHGLRARNKVLSGLMKTNREANVKFQNYVVLNIVSVPPVAASLFFYLYADMHDFDKKTKNTLYGLSAGCFVGSIVISGIAGSMMVKAINIYNRDLDKTSFNPKKEIKVQLMANGIGVNYRF